MLSQKNRLAGVGAKNQYAEFIFRHEKPTDWANVAASSSTENSNSCRWAAHLSKNCSCIATKKLILLQGTQKLKPIEARDWNAESARLSITKHLQFVPKIRRSPKAGRIEMPTAPEFAAQGGAVCGRVPATLSHRNAPFFGFHVEPEKNQDVWFFFKNGIGSRPMFAGFLICQEHGAKAKPSPDGAFLCDFVGLSPQIFQDCAPRWDCGAEIIAPQAGKGMCKCLYVHGRFGTKRILERKGGILEEIRVGLVEHVVSTHAANCNWLGDIGEEKSPRDTGGGNTRPEINSGFLREQGANLGVRPLVMVYPVKIAPVGERQHFRCGQGYIEHYHIGPIWDGVNFEQSVPVIVPDSPRGNIAFFDTWISFGFHKTPRDEASWAIGGKDNFRQACSASICAGDKPGKQTVVVGVVMNDVFHGCKETGVGAVSSAWRMI